MYGNISSTRCNILDYSQVTNTERPQTVAEQTRDKIFNGVLCADLICVCLHNKKPREELLTTVHCGASGYIYTMLLNRVTTRCAASDYLSYLTPADTFFIGKDVYVLSSEFIFLFQAIRMKVFRCPTFYF